MTDTEVVAQLLIEQLRNTMKTLFAIADSISTENDAIEIFRPLLEEINKRLSAVRSKVQENDPLLGALETLYDLGGLEQLYENNLRYFLAVEMLLPMFERKNA